MAEFPFASRRVNTQPGVVRIIFFILRSMYLYRYIYLENAETEDVFRDFGGFAFLRARRDSTGAAFDIAIFVS